MHPDFDIKLPTYIDHIKASYRKFWDHKKDDEIVQDMIREFDSQITMEKGKKYIKVRIKGATHSFIVMEDDGKFKSGDILKAVSYAAPARNFKRGNIITGDFQYVSWTGA